MTKYPLRQAHPRTVAGAAPNIYRELGAKAYTVCLLYTLTGEMHMICYLHKQEEQGQSASGPCRLFQTTFMFLISITSSVAHIPIRPKSKSCPKRLRTWRENQPILVQVIVANALQSTALESAIKWRLSCHLEEISQNACARVERSLNSVQFDSTRLLVHTCRCCEMQHGASYGYSASIRKIDFL